MNDSSNSSTKPKKREQIERKGPLTSASDLLQGLLENSKSPIGNQFQAWKVWRKWGEIVGDTISAHSEPVNFNKGTLWVWVESSSWLQQLSFFAPQIKESVNRFVGSKWIDQVRFTTDRQRIDQAREAMSKYLKD